MTPKTNTSPTTKQFSKIKSTKDLKQAETGLQQKIAFRKTVLQLTWLKPSIGEFVRTIRQSILVNQWFHKA